MNKPQFFITRSSENIAPPTLSSSSQQYLPSKITSIDRIDLKKFNEYLEDKINNKVYKNFIRNSKRENTESNSQHLAHAQYQRQKLSRPPSAQKLKEQLSPKSRNGQWGTKVNWKRHESIEKLLEKQNKSIENSTKNQPKADYYDESLELMEGKYQDLQDKYKRLMQDTIAQAKEFEENQNQLRKLKMKHLQDQEILTQLRCELMGMQMSKSTKQTFNAQTQTRKIKTQQVIQSDVSLNTSQLNQQPWKIKQEDKRDSRKSNLHSKGHKTSQSWMKKADASAIPSEQCFNRQSRDCFNQQNQKRQSCRYYSADKTNNRTRRNSKMKQSDHTQYTQIDSKTSIKYIDSLSNSKVRSPKQYLQQKFESEKVITPTLHKKMLNSNLYSKYRFQPTVRLN